MPDPTTFLDNTLRANNQPQPVSLSIDPVLKQQVDGYATNLGVNRSTAVRALLRFALHFQSEAVGQQV